MDNYIRIKINKDGKIINVIMNWNDASKPSENIIDIDSTKDIFLNTK